MASEQGQGEQTSSMAGEGEQGGGMDLEKKLKMLITVFNDHVEGNRALSHRQELDELFRFLGEHEAAVSQLPGDKKGDLAALLRKIDDVLELCKNPEEEEKKKKKKKAAAALKMGDCIPFKSSSRPPADHTSSTSVVAPLLKQARDILGDSSSSAPAVAGAGPNKEEVLYEWTTSYVDEERLYGWGDEAKEVADALAGPEEDDDDELFRAAGIFGIHGSGKTALAQKVFVHDRIKDTFPLRLWVCVGPTPPDDDKQQQYEVKFSLLYRMLDNLGLDTYKVEDVVNASKAVKKHGGDGDGDSDAAKESKIGVLLFILHEALAKTSYLIVLDDIRAYDTWYTNLALPPPPHGEWSDRLAYGLPKLNKSAVLVTCRKEEHARAMVRTGRVFHPPLLAVADAWKLFEREYLQEAKKKQVGYNVKDDVLYNDLKVVQEEMVGKCLGLPVAILEAAKGFAQYCTYVDDDDAKTTQPTTAKGADAGDPAHAAA
uniref:NB-ARC domain-containing protein n=1 Tax=Oryza glumipatula TaxID=40148 RepID=A0A0E0AEZ5_9ORYZ